MQDAAGPHDERASERYIGAGLDGLMRASVSSSIDASCDQPITLAFVQFCPLHSQNAHFSEYIALKFTFISLALNVNFILIANGNAIKLNVFIYSSPFFSAPHRSTLCLGSPSVELVVLILMPAGTIVEQVQASDLDTGINAKIR